MSEAYTVVMGDRGRLVVPAELRERMQLSAGTTLILLETPEGITLVTRDQLEKRVRADMAGPSVAEELIVERRAEAARANAE